MSPESNDLAAVVSRAEAEILEEWLRLQRASVGRRADLMDDQALASHPNVVGGVGWSGGGQEWTALFNVPAEQVEWSASSLGGRIVQRGSASLDEIFFARTGSTMPAPLEPAEA